MTTIIEDKPEETVDNSERLVTYKGPDRVEHFTKYMLERVNQPRGMKFVSGFASFDKHMDGLKTGEVVVVTGKKKNGKTLFAESWLRSMMHINPAAKAMILSFEMPADDLLIKYMGESGIPLHLPMQLKTMDFQWLYDRCLEASLKYDCKIVLIDHLHFMVDMNTRQNMSLNIGAFMRRLKQDIAIGLDMSVILIAHQSNLKKDDEASSDSMRDSSFIGQECDSVVVVSRKKNYTLSELALIGNADIRDKIAQLNSQTNPVFKGDDDPYSAGFAKVRIDVNRRTGVFEYEKVFKKTGNWLVEV